MDSLEGPVEQMWLVINDGSMSCPQSEHLMVGTWLARRGGKFMVLLNWPQVFHYTHILNSSYRLWSQEHQPIRCRRQFRSIKSWRLYLEDELMMVYSLVLQ